MTYTDLSGKWDVYLDESQCGKRDDIPERFPYEITLPDSTSNAMLGRLNEVENYGRLTDLYEFFGNAWFKRKIFVEKSAPHLMLFLERTRKTAVFVDGKKFGEYCSLCAPHRYSLDDIPEGEHELLIRVDNTDYPTAGGHLTSGDTQTNWNGITGRIGLLNYSAYPEYVTIAPDPERGTVKIRTLINGEHDGIVVFRIFDENGEYGGYEAPCITGSPIECEIALSGDYPLWSEHSPALLKLEITVGDDFKRISFGMRRLSADGLKLLINGSETFLRGKHDGLVFPKTGFAPTDIASWIKVFETAKRYGINHYRFHTCCPPEAAFDAADIMGIYLQPELPFWGTIPDELTPEHEFLREEGFRIIKEYSRHPSFVMMSMGNELWGSKKALEELIAGYKALALDILYVQGSNNFQFVPCVLDNDDFFSGVRFSHDRLIRGSYASCDAPFGHIQTDEPNSIHNYDTAIIPQKEVSGGGGGGEILIQYGTEMKKVNADASDELVPKIPVISHEVGQYVIYPDFSEINKYTGPLRHFTYEGYRETAEKKGLISHSNDFFRASGALAVSCYRAELETALRSRYLSGFQLLDLQDFPGQGTATVGILNAFLENKGLIEPNEWRRFCGKTVVLAELPKFVYESGETIRCGLLISNTVPDYSASKINWVLTVDGKIVNSGANFVGSFDGRIARAGCCELSVITDKAVKAELSLRVDGSNIINGYTLYVYPKLDVKITDGGIVYGDKTLRITHDIKDADERTLCIPYPAENDLRGEYCTDFWCYGMFRSISESMKKPVPVGTLGLYINTGSPLLKGFPCDDHTTPPWYALVTHSFCANLDGTDIEPDVWVIDNPQRASRLALLYRKNDITVCTSRLWEIAERPEVKCFAASLVLAITGKE